MPVTPPLDPEQAPEAAQKTLAKIQRQADGDGVPTEFKMLAHAPAFLDDAYANRRKYLDEGTGPLDHPRREALALAVSVANGCKSCVRSHAEHCRSLGFTESQVAELIAVAGTGAMYNVFYKFTHSVGDDALSAIKPMLRAHTWSHTSLDNVLVELIAVVVSVINSCDYCIEAHTNKALDAGASRDQIAEAVRIAAVMTAYNTYFRTQ
jgi:alkyl hydroperoxide reductase subunit D